MAKAKSGIVGPAKPIINGVGPNLKKRGTSHIWIYGENLRQGDTVEIVATGGTVWEGTINQPPDPPSPPDGTPQKARADVRRRRTSGHPPVIDDDFADITVTVTNSVAQPSDPHDDESVIDGP